MVDNRICMKLRPSIAACVLTAALHGEGSRYAIAPDPAAQLSLEVYKTGLMSGKKHLFVFEKYKGELVYDPQHLTASSVHLEIEAASAVCKDTWVSAGDLRKIQTAALNDMLAANRYPRLTFHSTRIVETAPGRYDVEGSLTIRGVAKPAVIHVRVDAGRVPRFEGESEIKLRDYGLKPPSAALGAVGTKNEMKVSFVLVAIGAN